MSFYISIQSHRAREKVLDVIPKASAHFSFRRRTTGGFYKVTRPQLAKLRASGVKGWTVLRPPYDDIRKCIEW